MKKACKLITCVGWLVDAVSIINMCFFFSIRPMPFTKKLKQNYVFSFPNGKSVRDVDWVGIISRKEKVYFLYLEKKKVSCILYNSSFYRLCMQEFLLIKKPRITFQLLCISLDFLEKILFALTPLFFWTWKPFWFKILHFEHLPQVCIDPCCQPTVKAVSDHLFYTWCPSCLPVRPYFQNLAKYKKLKWE